jgi:hypothetical protein
MRLHLNRFSNKYCSTFFGTGKRPNVIKGTKAICTVGDKREDDKIWHARVMGKDESSMNVEVREHTMESDNRFEKLQGE